MEKVTARTGANLADHGDGVVVRRPRVIDAIGGALRQAFTAEGSVPGELARTLDVLDRRR